MTLPPPHSVYRLLFTRTDAFFNHSSTTRLSFPSPFINCSLDGDIKVWDPRSSQSLQTLASTVPNLTSLDVHPQAEIFAVGSASQVIKIFNLNGDNLGLIRYHDGFMGQRIGPINCLAFHPHWVSNKPYVV